MTTTTKSNKGTKEERNETIEKTLR